MSERIEFYKNRSIGERFSVAFDFLKQNWKVLYKNILIGGLPLAIILGYFIAEQTNVRTISTISHFFIIYPLFLLVSLVNVIYLYSMTGAVLLHYDRNQLTETTGWNDLKGTFSRFAGKTTLIFLIVYIPIIIIVAIFAAILGFSIGIGVTKGVLNSGAILLIILFVLLFIGAFIAIAPSLTIIYFPAYFSGKTAWESIKTSFKLGFKNWGSLFVAILLSGIMMGIVMMIFYIPFEVIFMLTIMSHIGGLTIVSIIAAIFLAIGIVLTYPIMFVIFAFQYFSIVEREEGVSLQSKVDDFENL
jgi:uncharacterized membrane protein (DUF485 family)